LGDWDEFTGPIEAEGKAEFPRMGIWNVHGKYHIEMKYANGATMIIDDTYTNGIKFEGSEGWISSAAAEKKPRRATRRAPTAKRSKPAIRRY